MDLPLHEAADSFLQRGESFMSRVLPYWALRWVVQLRLVLLPLLAVWVPLFKILPWVIRWRGNRVLERHYAVLRDLEGAIAGASGAGRPSRGHRAAGGAPRADRDARAAPAAPAPA